MEWNFLLLKNFFFYILPIYYIYIIYLLKNNKEIIQLLIFSYTLVEDVIVLVV